MELNTDHMNLLSVAEENQGRVTFTMLQKLKGYTRDRFDRGIDQLIKEGIVWEDCQNPGETAYWFPAYLDQAESSAADIKMI